MTNEPRPIWYDPVPSGFWTQSKNRRAFMQWLERKLDIRQPEDWYQITRAAVFRYGGRGLLAGYYGDSAIELVKDYVPWYDWKEWLFLTVPRGFWKHFDNRRRYLEWLGAELGFEEMEDWYRLKSVDVAHNYGGSLLTLFKSAASLVMKHFPEYEWLPWKFSTIPTGYWDEPANVRRYLEWLGEKLGFDGPEDWYGILNRHLQSNRGGWICTKNKGAAAAVMKYLYPDFEWHPWKFSVVTPRNFWKKPENVRRYLEWLGDELGFEEAEDWYSLQADDLIENYGRTLLGMHGDSPSAVVIAGFPEYDLKEWWFNVVPNFFWDAPANVRRYLEWLGKELGFKTTEDWYHLTVDDLLTYRAIGLLLRFNQSVARILIHAFPERQWAIKKFRRPMERLRRPSSWDDPAFCRRYLERLGRELGFKKPEDWYRLKFRDFMSHRGTALMNRFNSSPAAVLKTYMPEHDWKEWLFHCPPCSLWKDRANRRRYLDWLADRLEICDVKGWGQLRCRHFIKNKGNALVKAYEWSVRDVILDTFPPDHPAVEGTLAAEDRKRLPRKSRSRRRS